MPGLLKTGAALALACLAMARAPQSAQAQTTKVPVLKLGVPLLGPAPKNDVGRPFVCWAPGTSAATVAAYERRNSDKGFATSLTPSPYRLLGQRWSATTRSGGGLKQGQPTILTYSFLPDNTPIDGFAGEAAAPSNLQARLNAIYGRPATWQNLFDLVVKSLGAQSGLTYIYEPADDGAPFGPQSSGLKGTRGDIRVGGHRIDGNSNILAYNFAPDFGDMVIDTADNSFDNRQGNSLLFRNTITHEFGHGVGLDHTCPVNESKLMEPFVSLSFDGPQFDDIRGLQRLYGDKQEDADTSATGLNLGALNDGTTDPVAGKILSIDDTADQDFYSFSLPTNKSLSVTVAPVGQSYLEGQQNADNSCSAGTQLDPKIVNDLGFELFKDDGAGNFVSAGITNSSTLGTPEILAATNFPAGGKFQVRVFGGAVKDIQTYSMKFVVAPPVADPTPVPTATAGPTPTPGPTAGPSPTPVPQPTSIRPVVDLNGANNDGSTGQDSPNPNGIDNIARYFYRIDPTKSGGAALITPRNTIVLSDISSLSGRKPIAEARVELTPDAECARGQGIAPDNCNPQNKRDNEVLSIKAEDLKGLNDGLRQNISVKYDNDSQILTINGGVRSLDEIRFAYEVALGLVRYENKLPIPGNNPFNRQPSTVNRILTYVVDTDTDDGNNQDNRFGQFDGPGSNPLQSKPAVLTLSFVANSPLVVTTTNDPSTGGNQISLRDAIDYANSLPTSTTPSVITFAANVLGTITLSSPLPAINSAAPITIQGPGASKLKVVGSGGTSVFQVNGGGNVVISRLAITGGDDSGVLIFGGNLTLDACAISGNRSFGGGGGVANFGGTLTVTNSTISGNSGDGISASDSGGTLGNITVTNSTISGNSGNGLTLSSNRATATAGNAAVSYSTITNNSGGGLVNNSTGTGSGSATVTGIGVLSLYNSVVSGNAGDRDVVGSGTDTPNRAANVKSSGYNIIGGGGGTALTAFTATTFDRTGITGNMAGLAGLGNNGGETMTHALFANSPAIDAGDPKPTGPPTTDQRGVGFPRVFNARIDIGAFERQSNAPVTSVVITPTDPDTNALLTATVTAETGANTPTLTYEWLKNGNIVKAASPDNTLDLSLPNNGNKGDIITVNVVATNPSGTSTSTDMVTVANTPPDAPVVTITATNPAPNAASAAVLTKSVLTANTTSSDIDNDAISYFYQWSINGVVNTRETGKTIDLSRAGNGDRDAIVSVEVSAFDGTDLSEDTGTDQVTVGNTAPVAQNVSFSVKPGETKRVPLVVTDDDAVDKNFTFTKTSNPTMGTATIELDANGRGVLVYTANANASGLDSLTFAATDTTTFNPPPNQTVVLSAAKTSANATATANIQLVTPTPTPGPTPGPTPPSNRSPSGTDSSVNTQREVPVTKVLAISDPDDSYATLKVLRAGGFRKGTGDIRKDADGIWKLFYKASGLYKGNDEVRFIVVDPKGAQSKVATITINLLNTKPTARSTKMQVAAGGSASVGIFGQDIDRDTVTFQRVGGPSKGTGEIRKDENGNFRFYYQNSTVAVGDDQVRFVAVDGQAGGISEVATIDITVVGVFNRAPSAQNVSGTTTSGTPVAVAVSGTDPDEGDVLTFTRVGGPSNGTGEISLDTDGTYKMFYTPRPGFVGTETIRYVAYDQKRRPSAPATITITVTPSAPSAVKSGPAPSAGSS